MESLTKNETWDVVEALNKKKIFWCKWIFKRKKDSANNVALIYKAWVVAKGYSNWRYLFSWGIPTGGESLFYKATTCFGSDGGLRITSIGWKGDIYSWWFRRRNEHEVTQMVWDRLYGRVCVWLKKSLYGLKQLPRQWYKRFYSFMITHDFTRSSYDSCVYL